jgi:hypothetical protein
MTISVKAEKTKVSDAENQKGIEETKDNNNLNMIGSVSNMEDLLIFEDLKPHKLFISDILY